MSSINIQVTSNIAGLKQAARKAPAKFDEAYDRLARRAAGEVAVRAKNEAPQADVNLANSLNSQRITLGQWVAGTGQQYAPKVEQGSKGGAFVPLQTMFEWVKRKQLVSRNPNVSQHVLAFMIQRSIFQKGTKANPFMQRTATAMQSRVQQIFDDGLQKVVDEVLAP